MLKESDMQFFSTAASHAAASNQQSIFQELSFEESQAVVGGSALVSITIPKAYQFEGRKINIVAIEIDDDGPLPIPGGPGG